MKKVLAVSLGILVLSVVLLFKTSTVYAEAYGWSPDVNKSTTETPGVCGPGTSVAPILYQPNHPALPQPTGAGQIRLQWTKVPGASGYIVYYGLSPKNYIYSVQLSSSSESYTIGYLANKTYYFTVRSKSGCAVGAASKEWGARPNGGGAFITKAAVGAVPLQRTTTPSFVAPKQVPAETEVTAPPVVAPRAPAAPKAVTPVSNPGLFESIINFFTGLFK